MDHRFSLCVDVSDFFQTNFIHMLGVETKEIKCLSSMATKVQKFMNIILCIWIAFDVQLLTNNNFTPIRNSKEGIEKWSSIKIESK